MAVCYRSQVAVVRTRAFLQALHALSAFAHEWGHLKGCRKSTRCCEVVAQDFTRGAKERVKAAAVSRLGVCRAAAVSFMFV